MSLLVRHGPLEPPRVLHILDQICDSLGEAHECGLVHQDIKPENVFVARYGRDVDVVKVLDFGLAEAAGSAESADEVRGSPPYMAPERAAGQSHARSDLYAVGCVAFYLLTGRDVFVADSIPQVMFAHAQVEPEPPSRFAKGPIPAELDAIVMWCLRKSPSDRPASADALRERLAAVPGAGEWTRELAQRWWTANVVVDPSQLKDHHKPTLTM